MSPVFSKLKKIVSLVLSFFAWQRQLYLIYCFINISKIRVYGQVALRPIQSLGLLSPNKLLPQHEFYLWASFWSKQENFKIGVRKGRSDQETWSFGTKILQFAKGVHPLNRKQGGRWVKEGPKEKEKKVIEEKVWMPIFGLPLQVWLNLSFEPTHKTKTQWWN